MDIIFILATLLAVLCVGIVSYKFGKMQEHIKNLEGNYGHTLAGRQQHNIGEADLFAFSDLRQILIDASERADYFARRSAHVAAGGDPDDNPTVWKSLRQEKSK